MIDQWVKNADVGEVITVPAGRYEIGKLVIDKRVLLVGSDAMDGPTSTEIVCDQVEIVGGTSQGAVLSGFTIRGRNGSDPLIMVKSKCELSDLKLSSFAGDGIAVVADAHSSIVNGRPYENANIAAIRRVQAWGGKRGLYMQGGDVNVCLVEQFSSIGASEHGVYDRGFLGSTYVACHVADSGLASYKTDNPNATHVVVGCYAEENCPPAEFSQHTLILGGAWGQRPTGGYFFGYGTVPKFSQNLGDAKSSIGWTPNTPVTVVGNGDHPSGFNIGYWDTPTGTYQTRHALVGNRVSTMFTSNASTILDEQGNKVPPGEIVLPKGFWVHVGMGRYRRITPAMLAQLEGSQ